MSSSRLLKADGCMDISPDFWRNKSTSSGFSWLVGSFWNDQSNGDWDDCLTDEVEDPLENNKLLYKNNIYIKIILYYDEKYLTIHILKALIKHII